MVLWTEIRDIAFWPLHLGFWGRTKSLNRTRGGHTPQASRRRLFILIEGRLEATFCYEAQCTYRTKALRSGDCFDYRVCSLARAPACAPPHAHPACAPCMRTPACAPGPCMRTGPLHAHRAPACGAPTKARD